MRKIIFVFCVLPLHTLLDDDPQCYTDWPELNTIRTTYNLVNGARSGKNLNPSMTCLLLQEQHTLSIALGFYL